jgi:hypothetical protein
MKIRGKWELEGYVEVNINQVDMKVINLVQPQCWIHAWDNCAFLKNSYDE